VRIPDRTVIRDVLLSLLSGALFYLAFPKAGEGTTAWVFLVPLLAVLRSSGPRWSFICGMTAGVAGYAGVFSWVSYVMVVYGRMNEAVAIIILCLMVLVLALFTGAFAWLVAVVRARTGLAAYASAPVIWVGIEFIRSFFPVSGFPWASLGYSQHGVLPMIQVSDLTGVYGISFLIVLVNCAVEEMAHWASDRARFPWRPVSIAAGLFALVVLYGYAMIDRYGRMDAGAAVRIALAQGNIEQDHKWDPAYQEESIAIYEKLTKAGFDGGATIVVWPETATPFFFQSGSAYSERVKRIPAGRGSLIFGSPGFETDTRGEIKYYNSAFILDREGRVAGRYDKMHLVPFGEYVPMAKMLFFVTALAQGVGDFSTGEKFTVFETSAGGASVFICYEAIFPDLVRRFALNGANLLVNITNDAWFGDTGAPHQHLSMAAFRAVENRRWLVRAANTGISGIIDPCGRITARSRLLTTDLVQGSVEMLDGTTFYTSMGDIFAWMMLALTAALCILSIGNIIAGNDATAMKGERTK
jgi:apolipoprotein N-acyltransferase